MSTTFNVYFNVQNLEKSIFGGIKGLKEAMQDEYVRVWNMFCEKSNSGVTEKLNKEWQETYPNYDLSNSEHYKKYNKFMSDGYQHLIVDEFNRSNISPILNFYVDPEECILIGYLKFDPNVTVDHYLLKEE